MTVADFDKAAALSAAPSCAQHAVRAFLDSGSGGAIVNVLQVPPQVIPKPAFVGYSVSKGGMQNHAHAGAGVCVTCMSGPRLGPARQIINRSWIDDPERVAAVESHSDARPAGDGEEMGRGRSPCNDEAAYHWRDACSC